ncbi:PaaX family transcriptional regulator C-terminal domain-containing protein [Saccharothrix sp. S26]|uniref:PaaX family transcriptional regulator C-terminal domain-containing protein n=1 Tax=Saccharothrix sp. S26 TaxID=2907215 RepID=UPI0035AC1441
MHRDHRGRRRAHRTEVMDTYRRFPALEPLLPLTLLPPDWPRARAREVFLAVYPAREHVRTVAVTRRVAVSIMGDRQPPPRRDARARDVRESAAENHGPRNRNSPPK